MIGLSSPILKKPALVLIEISEGKNTLTKLWKSSVSSFTWLERIVKKFEELGLVKREKVSRDKIITLTEDGKELAELFKKLI